MADRWDEARRELLRVGAAHELAFERLPPGLPDAAIQCMALGKDYDPPIWAALQDICAAPSAEEVSARMAEIEGRSAGHS